MSASQTALVTNPTSVSTFATTYTVFMFNPNILGAYYNLVEDYASMMGGGIMNPQVLPESVIGKGGGGFIVPGQSDPVKDPLVPFSNTSFSLNSLLADPELFLNEISSGCSRPYQKVQWFSEPVLPALSHQPELQGFSYSSLSSSLWTKVQVCDFQSPTLSVGSVEVLVQPLHDVAVVELQVAWLSWFRILDPGMFQRLEETDVNLFVVIKTSVNVPVLEKTIVERLLLLKMVKSFVHPYRLGLIEFLKNSVFLIMNLCDKK